MPGRQIPVEMLEPGDEELLVSPVQSVADYVEMLVVEAEAAVHDDLVSAGLLMPDFDVLAGCCDEGLWDGLPAEIAA